MEEWARTGAQFRVNPHLVLVLLMSQPAAVFVLSMSQPAAVLVLSMSQPAAVLVSSFLRLSIPTGKPVETGIKVWSLVFKYMGRGSVFRSGRDVLFEVER